MRRGFVRQNAIKPRAKLFTQGQAKNAGELRPTGASTKAQNALTAASRLLPFENLKRIARPHVGNPPIDHAARREARGDDPVQAARRDRWSDCHAQSPKPIPMPIECPPSCPETPHTARKAHAATPPSKITRQRGAQRITSRAPTFPTERRSRRSDRLRPSPLTAMSSARPSPRAPMFSCANLRLSPHFDRQG